MKRHNYDPDFIQDYLEDVLKYFKTAKSPSFSRWPTEEIGWAQFTRDENRFYPTVENWFNNRGINILLYNNTHRYLSTFILAAEFPPALGFQDHVIRLVHRNGWLSLYRNPEYYLEDYIDSLSLAYLTVAELQFLKKDSDGFYAFLELIKILSTIRFLLGKYDTLDEICVKIATEQEFDIDLIQHISKSYKSILIPDKIDDISLPSPKFEYSIQKDGEDMSLKIKHNLNQPVQISLPSSIDLNRFSLASVTVISMGQTLPLFTTSEAVSLEVDDSNIIADFGLSSQYFPLKKRNRGLKDIVFYLTAKNKFNEFTTINLGGIQRDEDFLVFNEKGKEIINAQRSFKMGQKLYFVPLSLEIGRAFQSSSHFEQHPCITLPIFTLKGEPEEITIYGITLNFCDIPFAIEMREQTPWELVFREREKVRAYFFSSNISFYLKYDLENAPTPNIKLTRVVRYNGIKKEISIQHVHNDKTITSKYPISSPGLYKLTVCFNKKSIRKQYVRLLPVRSVQLLDEKRLSLRLFKPPREFNLPKEQNCTFSINGDKVKLAFDNYGKYQIDALYKYQTVGLSGNKAIAETSIKLNFNAQQEVVGHFSDIVTSTSTQKLSLKKDFLPGSYLEFRRSILRQSAESYVVVAYMEGDLTKGVFPKQKRYPVRGEDTYPLSDIQQFVTKHAYSRLLLMVRYKEEDLFRAEFSDNLIDIISLSEEWKRGFFHKLLVVPISTMEKLNITDAQNIPENSVVYGAIENDTGTIEITTHGKYYSGNSYKESSPLEQMLAIVTDDFITTAEKLEYVEKIFKSPSLAYEFVEWFNKASQWDYPYDIIPLIRLIQEFPLIAVWADIARIPDNTNIPIPLIEKKAQFSFSIDNYIIPNVRNLMAYPMFLPELITLNDFKILEMMNLMIGIEVGLKEASLFYMQPFSERGKPVLSWISLFWLRYITAQQNQSSQIKEYWDTFGKSLSKRIQNIYTNHQASIPKYKNDKLNNQSIWDLFYNEQIHYINPIISAIPTLSGFFKKLDENIFTMVLTDLVTCYPLFYAEPYIKGFKESSKWKCIIFLSLYAVCLQIERTIILERLEKIYHLNKVEYTYLIEWIGSNTETSYIYNSYYEYWMLLFWEENNV